ncbi:MULTISPECIES: hybrid sensor histidine kinase/response regulator transcription factor [unclassified Sphingobacterium]|uniref:hybrid sensor histidine kinase/response regulator transcription factor n=1 Tax=unclassified Sphingobacterium TaxID=2609468 RepID=UPI0025E6664A|nr:MULTISPECIES: two-component regulator propeller domain-containing protein [unclassified Sphingobacterium]
MTKRYVRYIVIITLLYSFIPLSLRSQPHFGNLTYDKGLSNSTVLSICRDHAGFLWIGTRDGLNRYDGHQVKQYRSDHRDMRTISTNNYIYAIVEHPRLKELWIGTQQGLNCYDPKQDRFKRISYPGQLPKNGNHFAVLTIQFTPSGALLGTNNGLMVIPDANKPSIAEAGVLQGLEIFSLLQLGNDILIGSNKGLYLWRDQKNVLPVALGPAGAAGTAVKDIRRVGAGKIWVATDGQGLFEIDDRYRLTAHYGTKTGLASDYVRAIAVDSSATIWIGTMDGGSLLQPDGHILQQIRSSANHPFSINDNSIKTIYIDKQGIVWMGTNFGGINYHHAAAYPFRVDLADGHYKHLSGNLVSAIAMDSDGNTWVGTERDGLNLRRKGSEEYQKIRLRSNTIKCILTDKKYIYVGTFGAGLARINRRNIKDIIYYNSSGENGLTLLQNYIGSITQDEHGQLWIGTGNRGVQRINSQFNEAMQPHVAFTKNAANNYVKDVLVTKAGTVFIGTAQGLGELQQCSRPPWQRSSREAQSSMQIDGGGRAINPNGGKLGQESQSSDRNNRPQDNSLRDNRWGPLDAAQGDDYISRDILKDHYINTLLEDESGTIWIGTQEKGLFSYHPQTAKLTRIELFPSRSYYHVLGIAENKRNEIIVSTNNGLVFYHTVTGKKRYMDIEDGFPTNEFLPNAMLCYDGQLLVGSHKGLITLNVSRHKANTDVPNVLISGFTINGQDRTSNGQILGLKNPNYLTTIDLNHDQNTFTIDFSSDNLINPQKNTYAYQIEEIDQGWNLTDRPNITYTNLSPGKYTLKIKTANDDGVWSTVVKSLEIRIAPPFYKSIGAYTLYAVLLIAGILYVYRYNLEKKQLKTKLYYEEKHHQDQAALMQSKLDFFTKISHEIRTPLTLIHAPVEKILQESKLDNHLDEQLQQVRRNIKRLLQLTQELLTFNKMDARKLSLDKQVIDSARYFEPIYRSFEPIARNLGIEYRLENCFEGHFMADPQQLEKVLLNLLSNAFKFRREHNPAISIVVRRNNSDLLIHVIDNGLGIKPDERDRIFDTFYQGDEGHTKEGWGIGLAFAKELVELHQGRLYLDDAQAFSERKETVFTIALPVGIIPPEQQADSGVLQAPEDTTNVRPVYTVSAPTRDFHILIVEDNDELRSFLVGHLQRQYQVSAAAHGKAALVAVAECMPDLIITDIAMPYMDGYTLVRALKADADTAHIPVIMLTAKSEEQDSVFGYQIGIINYVTKPFNLQVLDLQIFNTVSALEQAKERNRSYLLLSKRDEIISSAETAYLDKLRATVEAHMADPIFSVAMLADKMGQSQSALLKKVKGLTGLSATELIKDIRLNEAANLLVQSDQVASVAYAVGFNDRKYFSKEFKKKFGVNPTQYRENKIN